MFIYININIFDLKQTSIVNFNNQIDCFEKFFRLKNVFVCKKAANRIRCLKGHA